MRLTLIRVQPELVEAPPDEVRPVNNRSHDQNPEAPRVDHLDVTLGRRVRKRHIRWLEKGRDGNGPGRGRGRSGVRTEACWYTRARAEVRLLPHTHWWSVHELHANGVVVSSVLLRWLGTTIKNPGCHGSSVVRGYGQIAGGASSKSANCREARRRSLLGNEVDALSRGEVTVALVLDLSLPGGK